MQLPRSFSGWWHGRRLVAKHSLIVLAVVLTLVPAIFAAIIIPSRNDFIDIEAQDVAAQTARARNAVKLFEENLSNSLGDYAYWDDSFNYMANPSKVFEESTLGPFTMQNMGVDAITYVRFDGTVLYASAVDLNSGKVLPDESAYFAKLTSTGSFLAAAQSKLNHLAYVRTSRGLYVLYSQWVNNSNGSDKPIGFMVMANLLSAKSLSDALQADAKLNLKISATALAKLDPKTRPALAETSAEKVKTSLAVFAQDNRLLATIDFETPRSLMMAGRKALFTLVLALVAGLALILLVLMAGIRAISVKRLQKLEEFVRNHGSESSLDINVLMGADEIASLGNTFYKMAEELATAEQELRQQSYLQGKADSASGMLHNVRNAIAPVRVMQEKWLRDEALPYRANMTRAVEELDQPDVDPSRKKQLEAFLLSAARTIALEAPNRRQEMEENKASIDQIAAILGSYNFDTSATRAGETLDFGRILENEIKILNARDGENVAFELPESFPPIVGNAIHLRQVLGNLLVNADEAMIAAGVASKKIIVSVLDTDETEKVHICLADNGDGVAAENLARIFERGYSTRNHKSGGLGMHWSANAMRAMGGGVALESDGQGKGAAAVLTVMRAKLAEINEEAALAA